MRDYIPNEGRGRQARARRFPVVAVYATLLVACSVYVLLDTFVIPRAYVTVDTSATYQGATSAASTSTSTGGATSPDGTTSTAGATSASTSSSAETRAYDYDSGNESATTSSSATSGATAASGTTAASDTNAGSTTGTAADATQSTGSATTALSQYRYLDTTIYVVDVQTSDARQLLTALANNTYGKNVTATTSSMAEANAATVAINGDFYGARNAGYVVRNGVLYRDVAASSDQEDLVIYQDGTFAVIREGDVSAQELVEAGAWQVFSFGPGLVSDGSVTVDANDEVGRAMASNPRTAIGQVGEGHYVLVVADGRTSESAGLSLQELATFMKEELGVTCAYNLDGGGSSTLWYQGQVVNNPTSGHGSKERSVSDIVYLTA